MFSLDPVLKKKKIYYRQLNNEETRELNKKWLEAFAQKVKEEKGKWVYNGYRWHGYSFGIQQHKHGPNALEQYLNQPLSKFYVFDEACRYGYECENTKYPDFSDYGDEVYVCDIDLNWSMAFTHEQLDLGPYFAEKDKT